LVRRGLDPHDRVTITIEPDEAIPGRREARARGHRRWSDRWGHRPVDRRGPQGSATAARM